MSAESSPETPVAPRTLESFRAELDQIDDTIHDLLMRRAAIVAEVGVFKRSLGAAGHHAHYRPGREALMLRRLAGRHGGVFPFGSIVGIWREIISAALSIETRMTVAVTSDAKPRGLWDLARDHFGRALAYAPYQHAHQVLGAVRDGAAAVAVLPVPESEGEPWWTALAHDSGPRIVARLPILAGRPGPQALVVARVEVEATGEDRGCLAVETAGPVSTATLLADLKAAGLAVLHVAAQAPLGPTGGGSQYFIETDGLVARDDPALERAVAARRHVARVTVLGGYALPVTGPAPVAAH